MTTNSTTDIDIPAASTGVPAAGLPLGPGRWQLDPYHSQVSFSIRHLGIAKVRGHFRELSATLDVGTDLDATTLDASIDVSTIDTGNPDRDAHVLAADMIDVARRPTLHFRSTGIRSTASGEWDVDGVVTLGDVECPLTMAVELGGVSEPTVVDGLRHAGFEAVAEVRRSDLGLSFGAMGDAMLGDVVQLRFDIQLVEPADASASGDGA